MTFQQIAGAALMLAFLGDIFLTVLYARAGTGLLAPYWNRAVWALLSASSTLFGRRRGAVLSLAGPVIVVALIGFWALGLTVGAALIIRPELGTSIRPSSGDTPTDFITAALVAGNSLSIVGSGDYAPHTAGTRILFLINSLIGASVLSLVMSYLIQVYSALRERNTLALTIHLMTASTGDAAEMLARLGLGEDGGDATSELSNLSRSLAATKEAHHFYPLLFCFRFEDPLYAVSRFSFVVLDLVTLIETALDQRRFRSLARSAPVTSLYHCALLLLATLDRNYPTGDDATAHRAGPCGSKQSYADAAETLERAGKPVAPDGMDRYVAERGKWEPFIRRVAPGMRWARSSGVEPRTTMVEGAGEVLQKAVLPRNVVIFAPADVHAFEIASVMDVFNEANTQAAPATPYTMTFVAERHDLIRCASGLRIVPDFSIDDPLPPPDTIIVAGSYGLPGKPSDAVINWLRQYSQSARRYGAVCTGAFLVGAAGLIDGRNVTTHWDYAAELRRRFPAARVDSDSIFVRDGKLFTSAGVSACIDLVLALIEEDHGRQLAVSIARHMVMYLKRPGGQSQFSVPLAAQAQPQSPIARTQAWILDHPDENMSLSALAKRAAMSPRNFSRVFRSETGLTPAVYVEQVRVDKVRRLLEDTSLSLDQVAKQSGLRTAGSARRVFLRRLGISLAQYRDRFKLG